MSKIRVAVLMGGCSSEREVSLWTGGGIVDALDRDQYDVLTVDPANRDALLSLGREQVDVAFIALHGRYGEDGRLQGMLDMLGIPYVGSGVLSSALAMNKCVAKKFLAGEGIPTPAGLTLEGPEAVERFVAEWDQKAVPGCRVPSAGMAALRHSAPGTPALERSDDLAPLPAVVKPNEEGSTIGMTIVRSAEEMVPAVRLAARHDTTVLIERFIAGTEITAAVLGNREPEVLPLIEIVPDGGFYDYTRKYTPGATEKIVPARIPAAKAARARDLALRSHRALQCWGLSRVDMIVAEDEVYVLEVNTLPGMTATSLVPRAAEAAGLSYRQLVERLIALALEGEGRLPAPGSRLPAEAVGCHGA